MPKINFTKMVASGNDFVVIDEKVSGSLPGLARALCDRKFGAGADGLLLIEKSKVADIKMRIFNADGSEAEMCGNGSRCAALYAGRKIRGRLKIETKAGIIIAQVNGNNVKIRLTGPKNMKLDIPIEVAGRKIKVNFINTGVPHVVIFTEGLDKIDVFHLGRQIRNHKRFAPAGANVNFIEVIGSNSIKIRTYERGVEDETLACGTGSAAAALIATVIASPACPEQKRGKGAKQSKREIASSCFAPLAVLAMTKINVLTKGGETLKVYFTKSGDAFSNVWLEGKARIVYGGTYNV